MHVLALFLGVAVQTAIVVDVQPSQTTSAAKHEMFTLVLEVGDVIYSADFHSSTWLNPTDFSGGRQVQATVENGKMTVRRRDGKTATAKIVRQQRVLVRPR
jgi:hypothetical protein